VTLAGSLFRFSSNEKRAAMPKHTFSSLLVCATALLAGCGEAEQPKAVAPPAERGIFISATDCGASGKLSAELCGQAIDAAVAIHEQQAPVYRTLRQCQAAEGPERCDKTVDGQYRARLQAFFVVMSDPPSALPLYPSTQGQIGFRQATRQAVDARDENINVSVAALTLANENAKLPNPLAAE
jgi:Protein of unknown function (DUF1190)